MESSIVPRRAADAATIAEAFRITVAQRPDEVAIRTKGDAFTITWATLRERVDGLAAGLAGLGLRRGDTLAIMLANRPEFHVVDLAAVMAGGTPFSVYQSYAPNQIAYVVRDAGARILVCEQAYLASVLEARRELPELEHVVVVDDPAGGQGGSLPAGCRTLAQVEEERDPDFDLDASVGALSPDDVLTLIYTSGTTGPPKGVELAHRNLLSSVRAAEAIISFPEGSRVISWLPAAHIAERAAHHYLPIVYGFQVTTCPDPREVMAYLPEVRPQWFFAVPRIWEKLKSGLESMLAAQQPEQRAPVQAALEAAVEKVRLEQRGEPVPGELAERVATADREIFSGLRTMLGLDQVAAINVGAAPTPVEVLEFFHAIALPLAELWGMSETCGAGAVNPPGRIKIGTVGPPVPGVEMKLDADGELLVRGDLVMLGYRNMPDKTAEALTEDGWLRTGDVGAFDEDGYLRIVDRKKELIINAAGKNMSPAYIEATLKSSSPLIGQACAIGDGRSYNTALIVLDSDFAPGWAAAHDLGDVAFADLPDHEAVRAAVQEAVDAANAKLARVEQIKKHVILHGDWLPGGEELTPTMKLKRKPIEAKYAGEIERMYG